MAPKHSLYLFIDTETGGLSKECSLLTFDATLLDAELNFLEKISYKIKPDDGLYKIQAGALHVNKINILDHDRGALPMSEASKQFRAWAQNLKDIKYPDCEIITVGQNVWFDIEFLKQEFAPDWSEYFSRRVLDIQSVSLLLKLCGMMPQNQRISLSELTKYFEIPIEEQNMHSSDVDVAASIEILKKCITLIQCQSTARNSK